MSVEPFEPDLRESAKVTYLPSLHRLLPQAIDAEKGTLCSFLISPRQTGQRCAENGITTDHFYLPAHALLFGVLREFWDENEPLDYPILTEYLNAKGMLANIGGPAYITELWHFVGTAANISNYCGILRDKFIQREVIRIGTEAASRAYEHQDDVPKLLNETVASMMKIVRIAEGHRIKTRSVDDLVKSALDEFEAGLQRTEPEMPTGIRMLDYYTGGLVAPEIWVIMARSTRGKSALAVNIMEHLAVDRGKRVGYISLEMGAVQLISRMLFSRAALNKKELEHRKSITDEEGQLLCQVGSEIAAARNRIFIREDGGLTPSEISATASAWKAAHGLDVLFIDHAQLARADGRSNGRTEEVEAISRSMNPLAKRLNIPIVILSQVTVVKEGSGDAPEIYSAKNSKALEEDADKLIVISHTAEHGSFLKIEKNREGERGIRVPVTWSPETQRFSDREEPKPEQPNLINIPDPKKRRK